MVPVPGTVPTVTFEVLPVPVAQATPPQWPTLGSKSTWSSSWPGCGTSSVPPSQSPSPSQVHFPGQLEKKFKPVFGPWYQANTLARQQGLGLRQATVLVGLVVTLRLLGGCVRPSLGFVNNTITASANGAKSVFAVVSARGAQGVFSADGLPSRLVWDNGCSQVVCCLLWQLHLGLCLPRWIFYPNRCHVPTRHLLPGWSQRLHCLPCWYVWCSGGPEHASLLWELQCGVALLCFAFIAFPSETHT